MIQFFQDYNAIIYREKHKDLQHFNEHDLHQHYLNHGIEEGRISCELTHKNDLALFVTNNFDSCLEISPFHNPTLKGNNVKYFDVFNKQELIEVAKKNNLTHLIDNIPEIHFVNSDANLKSIEEKFNIVLSCHSIEHTFNLVKHLNDVEYLLNPNGYYVVICPDKRYMFDHFIKETTIADVLGSYYDNQTKHTLKSLIEHRVLTCHNDCGLHWNKNHGISILNEHGVSTITNAINEFNNTKGYIDVHALQFTPNSFASIINNLIQLNLINFKIHRIYHSLYNSNEFYAVLQKK